MRVIQAICRNCDHRFVGEPKRSLLGLQKLNCPACGSEVLHELTTGYRVFYWVYPIALLALFVVNLVLADGRGSGEFLLWGVLVVVAVMGLVKDRDIRTELENLRSREPAGVPSQQS